ncbi:MAG: LLM class flavin-dependent oxidoreductase [Sphingomonadaceae bacterium]|nr:LLM class flavin-dependent oxidoreductase [Sphingomonadaceae bacterium]
MSIRIGLGAGLSRPLSPRDYWRWVDGCETAGIDSIWHSDQMLGPTPGPLAMLAALAARTERMRFGTNALIVPFRDPLLAAKQLATIHFLSGGRIFPVFGVADAADSYWVATGAGAKARGARSNEALALIRQLLEQDHVEFAGDHVRYSGPGVEPRPATSIPLWTGGHSAAAIRRTAALGDGWLGGLVDPQTAGATRRGIEAALAETGRLIEDDHYGVSLPFRIGGANDPAVAEARERLRARRPTIVADDVFAVGTADEVIALLRRHVAAGMSKFVLLPLAGDADDLIAQTRLLVRDVAPAIENRAAPITRT